MADSDRELLELAAKAAGYKIDQRASFMTWRESRRLALLNPQGGHTMWNAEEDDGDALRLAVKLQIDLRVRDNQVMCDHAMAVSVREQSKHDPCAATRLAIVRAAASIGKESK